MPQALLFALLAGASHDSLALGVGEPQLLSAFAQPLRVRVPVSFNSPEEHSSAALLHVELLPETDYPKFGVAEQHIDSTRLHAEYQPGDRGGWIEISSDMPIEEPATILLLAVRLGNTRFVKEVPLLLDFAGAAPPAAEAEEAAALDAAAALVPPPEAVASAAPAPAAARPHRSHPRPRAAVAQRQRAVARPAGQAVAAVPGLFQLSPSLRYTSASVGLRLAERFDTYAQWQLTHPAAAAPAAAAQPAAAGPLEAAAAPPAPAPQPRLPSPTPAAAPAQTPAPRAAGGSGGWAWVGWLFAAAAAAALALQRRRAQPVSMPGQFVATSATAGVEAVSSPAPAAGAAPGQDETAAPIRERLRKLSRANLDPDLARRALLVDAFLDLKRYDSAARLLNELEQDLAAGNQERPGVATMAAAVRR